MSKVLGLDLGTNSIGWAIVDEKLENKIEDCGVYIFPQGVAVEKNVEYSRAAERTTYRSARRSKSRRRLRKYETLKILIANNMCPLTMEELNKWIKYSKGERREFPKSKAFLDWLKTDEEKDRDPYAFRKKAVERKGINKQDLGRAFYHIAQRRGFKSNRKDKLGLTEREEAKNQLLLIYQNENYTENKKKEMILSHCEDETESKDVKKLYEGITSILAKEDRSIKDVYSLIRPKKDDGAVLVSINEISEELAKNSQTLGQYFYDERKKGNKIRGKYTSRDEHYLKEFEKICEKQKLNDELALQLKKAIFYQRPLKSQKHLVGNCTLEKNKTRCPISHILFEEFRALQFINSIKYKLDEKSEWQFLSEAEKNKILPKFFRVTKNFKFGEIRKVLFKNDNSVIFNYKDYTLVSTCQVSAKLKNIFGDNYKEYKKEYTVNGKKKSVDIYDIWHILYSFDDDQKIIDFAVKNLELNEVHVIKLSKISIPQGYANLSLKAIKKILVFLKQGYLYTTAVFLANIPEIIGEKIWKENSLEILDYIKTVPAFVNRSNNNIDVANIILKELIQENQGIIPDSFTQFDLLEDTLRNSFGKTTWKKKDEESKNSITKEISDILNSSLQLGIKKEKSIRQDEVIINYLSDRFNIDKNISSKKIYHPSDISVYPKAKIEKDGKIYLGSPRISSIKNPMATRALFQLRKLVNYLLKEDKIDNDTAIRIEMANELNDSNTRAAMQWYQRERESENNKYKTELAQKQVEANNDNVLKYRLWEEQKHICIYTGKEISFTDLFGPTPTVDIEHTLPRSLCYDDSQENKTLCFNDYNRKTKKQILPRQLSNFDEIRKHIESIYKKDIDKLQKDIAKLKPSGGYSSIEQKNKRIQKQKKLKLELKYLESKYKRFFMETIPDGFKPSQLVDTRIINKYALGFLKTAFSKTYSVKGITTDLFRKMWKIDKKDRSKHNHHAIDAIIIACSTPNRYNSIAQMLREKGKGYARYTEKPWNTFNADVKNATNYIFVKYYENNNPKKQSKKKLRIRGKIQKINGKPIYLQGSTIRGRLHQETYYGRIKDPSTGNEICVIRKPLDENFKKEDIEKIIDSGIKKIINNQLKEYNNDFKALLKNGILRNPDAPEDKKIYIKKVRIKAQTQNPIILKEQAFKSKKTWKQNILVQNDTNYLATIYRGLNRNNKEISDFRIINLLDLSKHSINDLIPKTVEKDEVPLGIYKSIKNGSMVLIYENNPEELSALTKEKLWNRYYKVAGLAKSGGALHIKLKQSMISEVWKYESLESINKFQKFKRFQYNQIKCLVEGADFEISPDGNIKFL